MKEVLLNIESGEIRCALLKQGQLADLQIERASHNPLTGNIYRGKVTNILHNIQSAFININEGENGFIHISDIIENTQKFQEMFDMDFECEVKPKTRKKRIEDIDKLLKIDQPVLVQVVKEPIGSKGARLTSNISVPGRYLVLLPNTPHRGVSRKIQDRGAREQLKKIIRAFEMPQDVGLICRTASMNASKEMLIQEANELLQTWEGIMAGFQDSDDSICLYRESDLVKKALIRAVDKKYDRMLIDDYKTFQRCRKLYQKYKDEHPLKIEYYRDTIPMFERFCVEVEIDKALRRKIWLPSGGYLFFEKTEAMTTIDVNSGRSRVTDSSKTLEESLVHINMEAAEEIARQLKLRNIGGLVICDFIDMRSRKNGRRVLTRLKEAMREDSAKCTVLGMSDFGLVEMTRQRARESLHQLLYTHCPYCTGIGHIKNHESVMIDIERGIRKLGSHKKKKALKLVVHPELETFINHSKKNYLSDVARKWKTSVKVSSNDELHLNAFEFMCAKNDEKLEV
ncbi:MAG: Ribonuclease G [Chlamydiia bacterium]|nr:Ribonuclease G [Chlamydiia bacterium]MCH9615096.1 Ribonuclease G [Chlamydiia bacterium]MCH9628582.1 Ribonuclease G [Chlamydiia bacterium]